jgi:hypothetical protein
MKKCNLSGFMKSLSPWLDQDYIRKVCVDKNGNLMLIFTDGVKEAYEIEDCTQSQLTTILEDFKKRSVPVEFFR